MRYFLLASLTDELLVEAADHFAARRQGKEAGLGDTDFTFMSRPVSGCEARQYVKAGRKHTTTLTVVGRGKVARRP